jgi:hypothetical protein
MHTFLIVPPPANLYNDAENGKNRYCEGWLPPSPNLLSILSQAVTEGSTGQALQFVGAVGIEDQVVD